MQTAGRNRPSGCDLFSAASPLEMSTNKAWAISTAVRNSEHMRAFLLHRSIPVAVGLNQTFPLINVICPFGSIGLTLFS